MPHLTRQVKDIDSARQTCYMILAGGFSLLPAGSPEGPSRL